MPTRDLLAIEGSGLNDRSAASRSRDSKDGSTSIRPHLVTGVVVSVEGRIHREGLVALLATQADFRVLGSTDTCSETIALCSTHRPQVLVLGIHVAWARDSSPLEAIRLASPKTGILALAPHSADRCSHLNPHVSAGIGKPGHLGMARSTCLQESWVRGAHAALDGDADPGTLFDALRAVGGGERWGVGRHGAVNGHGNGNARGNGHGAGTAHGHSLSPQELKVARLVGQGASNKEIATSLAISDLTVKKHVGSVLQKLGLHDRLQLGLCVARYPLAFNGESARD